MTRAPARRHGGRGRGVVAAGSVVGALAAHACCVLPLALVTLGVGGAWAGNLAVLARYRPFVLLGTVVLLGIGYRMAYRPAACADGAACARPLSRRAFTGSLWLATALVVAALAVDLGDLAWG